jgi:hypothetical protein
MDKCYLSFVIVRQILFECKGSLARIKVFFLPGNKGSPEIKYSFSDSPYRSSKDIKRVLFDFVPQVPHRRRRGYAGEVKEFR